MPDSPQTGGFGVSIVSHGQGALCARLLADLAQHSAGVVSKVILTLNIPEDLPALPGLPFPVELICNAHPKGYGENHNQAFARSAAPYFAVLNPDLRIQLDPFAALRACLQDPGVGIVAPMIREADGAIADFARALVSPWDVLRRRLGAPVEARQLTRPDWIAGMFLAFRSGVYSQLGGFDTRYFLYCEDVDICARARLLGLRLEIARETPVTHFAQRESRRSLRRMRLHVASLLSLWSSRAYRDYRALLRGEALRQ